MFNIGDKVFASEFPNKIYKVIDVNTVTSYIPNYTLLDEDGVTKWESYCIKWHKLMTPDECLRYGEVLADDNLYCKTKAEDYKFIRIRTICYDNRIFYHKMVNGEVIEFKELTT